MNVSKFSKALSYAGILLKNNKNLVRNINQWETSLTDPVEFYLDAFRFYYFNLPRKLKSHKFYFNHNSRGFGEKAFHTMWYLLYEKYRFKNFLEIGIYRGQTMSLIGLLAKIRDSEVGIYGISPFTNAGDHVSHYVEIDYREDVIKNFDHFSLPRPNLIRAYSTDKKAVDLIFSKLWDCVYIDGSHDYEIAKQDWLNCSQQIKPGGIVVLDDASLYTNYQAPFFAFSGHPGPSKVADEIQSDHHFNEVLRVGHNRVFEKIS